ncbi:YgdI/YgdR family lipoprotein, partial [bacterium]|nr:YgdI/YgdR family lipoprotein [bacterium]
MKKLFKLFLLMVVLTVGGAAIFVYFTKQQVVVLKDGTIKTVDTLWESESGELISYEVDGETTLLNRDEIKSYGERNLGHIFRETKSGIIKNLENVESGLNRFLKKSNITVGLSLTQNVFLLGLLLFSLIILFSRFFVKKKPEQPVTEVEVKETVVAPQEVKSDVPTCIDIVAFFLDLFKKQIGADPDAAVEYVPLMSKNSGPNHIYELRVKQMADWTTRRMTIGPLGEESGSKSKCYYVIYDVHMVVKIPPKPVTDFEQYIESIKKEVAIVNKLIPKECIIPNVSVILEMVHSFTDDEIVPSDSLEDNYINWMRRTPEYQKYLKINNTFVYIMDLSKYYFLSHILDELHNIKHLISREITENAENIWEPAIYKGRYGTENDAILEIRDLFNRSAVTVRRLVDRDGITTTVSDYQIQSWFITHLADGQISAEGS